MCAGGYIFTPYDTTPQGGYTAINTTQLYDPVTGAWQADWAHESTQGGLQPGCFSAMAASLLLAGMQSS